ncbi:MAG TPA: serine/threonine-protein kinase [Kofleriaceae bacterium]|nr:serine/threonine-protein kinase [Kofleriaceae bacterium]
MTHEGGTGLSRLGSYEILRPIAHGGMADIYLARPAGGALEPPVALKVLSEARAADAELRALFFHEARVCTLLDHPNIASVLDVDVADGRHYLTMEYVDGVDLRELLAAAGRASRGVPYEVAVAIIAAAAAGLDHAHRRCDAGGRPLRLVHRDVSLSNLMVGHDGAVKVVDFGIASTTISDVHTLPGIVRGKASYMSPEQCLGDELDHRTDVFALGVVLYELTTGARCFHGKSDFERMLAVVRGDYIPPSQIVAGYPHELERVIRTALASAPEQRYASCADMIEALEAVRARHGWAGGAAPIARLMVELFRTAAPAEAQGAASIAALDAALDAALPGGDTVAEPAVTARQPVLPEILAASGAIPPHALAIASAPTAPRWALARGSTRRLGGLERAAVTEAAIAACEKPTRELWLDDDDARTRGRRVRPRRASAPKLAA